MRKSKSAKMTPKFALRVSETPPKWVAPSGGEQEERALGTGRWYSVNKDESRLLSASTEPNNEGGDCAAVPTAQIVFAAGDIFTWRNHSKRRRGVNDDALIGAGSGDAAI